ncbi:hypothetical protein HN911_01590 [Candidatus Bathyarchaeota archaeon]|jgi:hypothetical protein|nr:hypothetical protein [Candidatus Bathyarchaeota archaeon]
MRSRRAVGSLIGIGFLLMILAVGFSFYEVVNRIERSSNDILLEMSALDRDAADEALEFQRVRLTGGNSLNLTIKNTGDILAELEWIGVFDDTSNTQDYYRVDTSLSPNENQTDIGNATIVMNPLNDYTIQVLTKRGNIYYGEFPDPGAAGGSETQYFYVDNMVDSQTPLATGTHSLFSAMQSGPDEVFDTLTEGTTAGSIEGFINNTIVDSLEFDTGNGQTPSIIPISGDIYAIAYDDTGDIGSLTTVEITSTGQITNTIIDTLVFDAIKGKTAHIIPVSGDVYAIAYSGNTDDGMLITVEIATNGQITDTVIDSLEFVETKGKEPNILHISGNVYAVAYQDDLGAGVNPGVISTVEILANGDIGVAVIDSLVYDAVKGKSPKLIHVSGEVYALAYSGDGDDGHLATYTISNAGAITDTPIDSLEYDSVKGKWPDIIHVSGTTYAIAYSMDGDVGKLVTIEILPDGSIGAAAIDSLQFVDLKGKESMILQLTGDIYVVTYQDDQGAGNPKPGVLNTVEILSDGSIGAAVIDSLEFDAVQGKSPSMFQVSADIFAVAFEGVDSDGFLSTIHFLTGGADYLLDLEVNWTGLPSMTNEYLAVYGGTMGAETLLVDYWDGGSWVNIIASVASGWNIVDVSSELTSTSFTIRFVDATQTSDAVQDTWEIDFAYLNLFD